MIKAITLKLKLLDAGNWYWKDETSCMEIPYRYFNILNMRRGLRGYSL